MGCAFRDMSRWSNFSWIFYWAMTHHDPQEHWSPVKVEEGLRSGEVLIGRRPHHVISLCTNVCLCALLQRKHGSWTRTWTFYMIRIELLEGQQQTTRNEVICHFLGRRCDDVHPSYRSGFQNALLMTFMHISFHNMSYFPPFYLSWLGVAIYLGKL